MFFTYIYIYKEIKHDGVCWNTNTIYKFWEFFKANHFLFIKELSVMLFIHL